MNRAAAVEAPTPTRPLASTPHDQRVESWAALHEALFEGSWQPALGRFRSDFAFRGQASAEAGLPTSLMRLGGDYEQREADLLRNFRKYAGLQAVPVDSTWNWLSVARHHGLPTRLLDWSFSPYVALHFATAQLSLYAQDAAIWCVNFNDAHRRLPARLRQPLEAEGSGVFTVEMLGQAAPTLADFDALAEAPFTVFFEPPALDARLVNQFALFSLLSDPRLRFDEWLLAQPVCYKRLIVPAELKWEIRDKLDMANVTERVLFPGLDGLSRWLARHYMQR
jgi:hypothetical protein